MPAGFPQESTSTDHSSHHVGTLLGALVTRTVGHQSAHTGFCQQWADTSFQLGFVSLIALTTVKVVQDFPQHLVTRAGQIFGAGSFW